MTSDKTIVKRDNRRCLNEDETRNLMRKMENNRNTILMMAFIKPGGMDIRSTHTRGKAQVELQQCVFSLSPLYIHCISHHIIVTHTLQSPLDCNTHEDHRSHGTYRLHHGLAADLGGKPKQVIHMHA